MSGGRLSRPIRVPRRSGFTLLELIISVGIATILLAGLSSALFVAVQAINPKQGSITARAETVRSIQPMLRELHYATAVQEYSVSSITFTLADRTGDGSPEQLHYEWSGVAGDPLVMRINANPPVIVLPQLASFQLRYETQAILNEENHTVTRMISVTVDLRFTGDTARPLETMVILLNRPEVSS